MFLSERKLYEQQGLIAMISSLSPMAMEPGVAVAAHSVHLAIIFTLHVTLVMTCARNNY